MKDGEPDSGIEKTKIYEFLTSQVALLGTASLAAFRFYVQVFSAIVGGSIWLSLEHPPSGGARALYTRLSDGIVLILTIVVTAMVVDNLRSWYLYRADVAKLGDGIGFSKPFLIRSAGIEAILLTGIWVVFFLFHFWNPFTIPT